LATTPARIRAATREPTPSTNNICSQTELGLLCTFTLTGVVFSFSSVVIILTLFKTLNQASDGIVLVYYILIY